MSQGAGKLTTLHGVDWLCPHCNKRLNVVPASAQAMDAHREFLAAVVAWMDALDTIPHDHSRDGLERIAGRAWTAYRAWKPYMDAL